jgi:hypothetical protein
LDSQQTADSPPELDQTLNFARSQLQLQAEQSIASLTHVNGRGQVRLAPSDALALAFAAGAGQVTEVPPGAARPPVVAAAGTFVAAEEFAATTRPPIDLLVGAVHLRPPFRASADMIAQQRASPILPRGRP